MNNIKLRDARRILKANGYEFEKIAGDHFFYLRGNHRIVVPFHNNKGNECNGNLWKAICKRNNIQY